jgi:hypothetical protein
MSAEGDRIFDEATEQERARVLAILDRWKKSQDILLAAGEMTAQELRTVKAVVAAIRRQVEAD